MPIKLEAFVECNFDETKWRVRITCPDCDETFYMEGFDRLPTDDELTVIVENFAKTHMGIDFVVTDHGKYHVIDNSNRKVH